jgi:hypothetical protein
MIRLARLALPLFLVVVAACSDSSRDAFDPADVVANPLLGQVAFEQSCAGCHASHDGFDLKMFQFTDTTIIRRAVKHVDTTTARNVVAYIRSLQAPPTDSHLRLFQPKGAPLQSDVEFATALFGKDAWPESLTTEQLKAIDTRTVQVAVKLPVWADEASNMDWMPDFVLPPGILDYSGGLARAAIAGYNAAPTTDNLVRAINAIRTAERATANPSAPCLLEDAVRVRFRECFEVRRWASTLVAMHMMRFGLNTLLAGKAQDIWWDTGKAARDSRNDATIPIANVKENWATWMFLGWSFDPSLHSSSYTGGGFSTLALMRHATFVALKSEVSRPASSTSVYEDVMNAAKFAPNTWTLSAVSFGLRNLNERLSAGERPTGTGQPALAISQVNSALTEANKKLSVTDRAALLALAQPVLAMLQQ